MSALKILLLGETWVTHGIHQKGAATYTTGEYSEGHQPLTDSLGKDHEVTVIPNHLATTTAPWTAEDWDAWDVVILSDIAADTLLLHNDPFVHGKRVPNRLGELKRWVEELGGGLLMIGGYMSFSGFEGKGNYHFTPLADALPVTMFGYDDRVERPEGISPVAVAAHPVLEGIDGDWPGFLGYNKLKATPDAEVPLEFEGDPFLALRTVGTGRTSAFASDCSPHWGSPEFLAWPHYGTFWDRLVRWTAGTL